MNAIKSKFTHAFIFVMLLLILPYSNALAPVTYENAQVEPAASLSLQQNTQTSELSKVANFLDDNYYQMDISDDIIFMASGNGGLRIYRMLGVEVFELIDKVDIGGTVTAVQYADGYVFLVNINKGLQIIDVRSFSQINVISQNAIQDLPVDIFVANSYLYVLTYDSTLQVFDISDPTTPVLAGSLNIGKSSSDIVVKDNYAFLLAPDFGMIVVDVSNLSTLNIVSEYPVVDTASTMYIDADTAYVANGSRVEVLNISDPTTPVHLLEIASTSIVTNIIGFNTTIFVTENLKFTRVFDYSNGTAIEITRLDYVGDVADGFFRDRSLYLSITNRGFFRYDLDADLNESPLMLFYGYVRASVIEDDLLYVLTDDNILIMDISVLDAPNIISVFSESHLSQQMEYKDGYLFVTDYVHGILIIDVSDPSSPTLVTTIPGRVDRFILSDYLFVYDGQYNIWIYDIRSIYNINTISSVHTEIENTKIFVYDNLLFLANQYRLEIYNVTIKSDPIFVEIDPGVPDTWDVFVRGRYMYVIQEYGFSIYEYDEEATLSFISAFEDTTIMPTDTYVNERYLFFTSYLHGLMIYDISDKENPRFETSYNDGGFGSSLTIAGDYAYVSDVDDGLEVFDISPFVFETPTDTIKSTSQETEPLLKISYPGLIWMIIGFVAYLPYIKRQKLWRK